MAIKDNVFTDKDSIKDKLVDILKDYEDLDNIDMSKLGFHSYVIDALSFLTSDSIFMNSMGWQNAYMIIANLQEAIYNHARYLSYTVQSAQPSRVMGLIYFRRIFDSNDISFTIPQYHKFYANDLVFVSEYEIVITVKNNNIITIRAVGENFSSYLPFEVRDDYVYFNLLLTQYEIEEEEILINNLIQPFQFYNVRLTNKDYLYKLEIINTETDFTGTRHAYTYEVSDNTFSMGPNDRKYVLKLLNDTEFELLFGNGRFGKQLLPNSVLTVTKFTTKGENGRIIKGALNKMDRIYTTVNNIQELVDINVTNVVDGYGGTVIEDKYSVKENAIRQFRSKKALTSEQDYSDYTETSDVTSLYNTKPLLKRSDLKVNEIVLFHTLQMGGEVLETNSITQTFPDTTEYIDPYVVFTDTDGTDYVCPFALRFNDENRVVSYIYYLNTINLIPFIDNFDMAAYPITFKSVKVYTNTAKTEITFELYYDPINTNFINTNLTGRLNLKYPHIVYRAGDLVNDTVNNVLSLTIPVSLLHNGTAEFQFELFYNGTKFADGGPEAILMQVLDDRCTSYFKTNAGEYTVYDIPVLTTAFMDTLTTEEDLQNFEFSVVQDFLSINLTKQRAFNVFVNNKFTKTVGTIKNYFYNLATYEANSFILTLPGLPNEGDTYIIDKDTTVPNLIEYRDFIARFTNGEWEFIRPIANEIAYVSSVGQKMTYTGTRWYHLEYTVNLPIDITVFIDPSFGFDDETIKEEIKTIIISQVEGRFGSDRPIYRSEIISTVQQQSDVLGIVFCELNRIESDILFNYNIDTDLTKAQLIEYVPEYIHIKKEDIVVNVKRINKPERF